MKTIKNTFYITIGTIAYVAFCYHIFYNVDFRQQYKDEVAFIG